MSMYGRAGLKAIVWRLLVPALLLLMFAPPADGQDRRERRQEDRQEMERRIRAQMSRMIREELDLTEAEYEPVSAVMNQFADERRRLARSERELRRELESVLEGRAEDATDAASVLRSLVEIREREATIFSQEQEALLEILTPIQVLQLHSLRERISRRIRDLRGRRGGEDGDRGELALARIMGTIYPYPVSL
ncbi:MAG: hypothetical protein KJO65_09635 [Gemmatimonadetes bacterium]|nr:hypothetical protein [Gemmatimonadota bacterium]